MFCGYRLIASAYFDVQSWIGTCSWIVQIRMKMSCLRYAHAYKRGGVPRCERVKHEREASGSHAKVARRGHV